MHSRTVATSEKSDAPPPVVLFKAKSKKRATVSFPPAAPGAELGGVSGKTMDDLDDKTYGNLQYVNVGPYDK